MYVARAGMNITKDMRATLEGMLINEKSLAGSNLGDTFWVGATVGANFGVVKLDAAGIYGQRQLGRAVIAGPGYPFEESGFGGYRDRAGADWSAERLRGGLVHHG